MDLQTFLDNFIAVRENLPTLVGECMLTEQDAIVAMNAEQMLDGVNTEDSPIGEYHSKGYALTKNELNPKAGFGNVDLKLTGDFQDRMYLIANNGEYEVNSSDEKTNKLIGQYGDEIFGLTDKNKEKTYELIHPSLIEKVASEPGCEIV